MFIHFFSCDSLIFIINHDQNSSNIKLHVIFFMHSNNSIQFLNTIKQKFEI